MAFWPEFLLIASVHFLAVVSPGPDFAIVLRYAIRFGKKAALAASCGIGLAILLHVTWSLMGIALLIKSTPWLFSSLTWLMALYLIYIGINALKSSAPKKGELEDTEKSSAMPSCVKAFIAGFVTNGLNPKATLFFLSLFAVIISADTPFNYKVIYGIYMAFVTALWFCFLSFVLTRQSVRHFLLQKGFWFDKAMGVLLITLALQLIYSNLVNLP